MGRAIECFERLLAIDPGFAPAICRAGRREVRTRHSEWRIWCQPGGGHAAGGSCDHGGRRPWRKRTSNSGRVFGYYDWDWEPPEAAFKRAIQLKPSLAEAYQ